MEKVYEQTLSGYQWFFRLSPANVGQVHKLQAAVNSIYNKPCKQCGGYHRLPLPSLASAATLPAVYEAMLKRLHKGILKAGMIDKATALDTAAELLDAMFGGYGKSMGEVDYNTPDYEMLAALEKNVFHFSAAKNYQELKALSLALKDGTRVRTFSEFRQEAVKILDTWQNNWLAAEYDTAIGSAQMAARWTDYHNNGGPLRGTYQTAGDERVSPEHALLNDITKDLNDPFWNTYWPPLRWRCRCDVVQTSNMVTNTDNRELPKVPKLFSTNLAKDGLLFPSEHPYYKDIPANLDKYTTKLQAQNVRSWAKEKLVGETASHLLVKDIQFGNNAIKEALNQPHKHLFEKNQAIYKVRELIPDARYVKKVADAKGRPFTWHYLETTIANEKSYILVREDMAKGDKMFYTIVDAIK